MCMDTTAQHYDRPKQCGKTAFRHRHRHGDASKDDGELSFTGTIGHLQYLVLDLLSKFHPPSVPPCLMPCFLLQLVGNASCTFK
jgi:hypothetical protein